MKNLLRPLSFALSLLVAGNVAMYAQKGTYVLNLEPVTQGKGITDIYLSSAMIRNSSLDFSDAGVPSLEGIIRNTESIRIFTADTPEAVKIIQDTFAPICNLKNRHYETLFSVKSDGAIIRLVGKSQKGKVEELYLLVDDDKEIVAMIFGGKYTRQLIDSILSEAMPKKTSRKATK